MILSWRHWRQPQAVLTNRQKELGVAVVDMGGGTTSLAVFEEGQLLHTAVIPVGSGHITNDIAIGLRTSIETAEHVKLQYAYAIARDVPKTEEIDLSKIDPSEEESVSRHHLAEITEARLEEIFDLVSKELKKIGRDGQLPAGLVLTGAGSRLPGLVELAKKNLRLPVQIAIPANITTVIDRVEDPSFATAVGLVIWANEYSEKGRSRKAPIRLLDGKAMDTVKKLFKRILP